ncbi:class A beta-lactamase [Herbaspirillum sp. RTI4]|uniref:class A beta-lactamase n=1 Tax=Herbaspirillum sp. RTI4 TaxID=3048640 RepID=UPI002AB43F2A|nr:class A beta-lactamase [Herbaspirillum sp. RTI4]MDY7577770.1 class A beta-lactamase [Herbaspirillum sp. RTI4]MEA9980802.1 class A beta-lactamase [Herbaspirillum sp. RTI4]
MHRLQQKTPASTLASPLRRCLILTIAAAPVTNVLAGTSATAATSAETLLRALETESGGRLGVYAQRAGGGMPLSYRSDERFPLCSTFKLILASAILDRSRHENGLLQHRIRYSLGDLVTYSPVTSQHVAKGMTIAELCAAALQYSDNTAANLLMKVMGGPSGVTAYARSIGDKEFRIDRWETELNTAIPGDPRDTSTPAAMATSCRQLVLGEVLAPAQRAQLQRWIRGNTTGAARIRSGVPSDWKVGDKTGSGDYGTTNDVGVIWPPAQAAIVLALYFTQHEKEAASRNEVLAAATRIVVAAFG